MPDAPTMGMPDPAMTAVWAASAATPVPARNAAKRACPSRRSTGGPKTQSAARL